MSIMIVGLNHRSAPVEIREQMAFSAEGTATALMLFIRQFPGTEAMLLSTCNRLEMLVASDAAGPTADDVARFFAQARDLPIDAFRRGLYHHEDEAAVRHLFRVASGLDSMVVGEYQIVNQLKQAYATASEQGATGRTLNRLMHHAFNTSARIRTETGIGRRKVSIPSVAVEFARGIFSDFTDKQTLVVGAGEMAQLLCQHLQAIDARKFVVTSRTLHNARVLAEACDGRAVSYDQLDEQLVNADIVISAVRCPKAILTRERVRRAQQKRRGRPLYMIDLAVPRNIEPEVAELRQVYVQDIDQLGCAVEANQSARLQEVEQCEQILDEQVEGFLNWLAESQCGPMISQMYGDAKLLRDREVRLLFNACQGLTADQKREIERMTDRLLAKLMHPCVSTAKQHSATRPAATLAAALHNLVENHVPEVDKAARS